MQVRDLKDAALDWAVAYCEGGVGKNSRVPWYKPSVDWEVGAPIMEREKISVVCRDKAGYWLAYKNMGSESESRGPTPLIAVMRCYVASRLGTEIDVPADLLTQGDK